MFFSHSVKEAESEHFRGARNDASAAAETEQGTCAHVNRGGKI